MYLMYYFFMKILLQGSILFAKFCITRENKNILFLFIYFKNLIFSSPAEKQYLVHYIKFIYNMRLFIT